MTESRKVSAVIPCFNHGEFLAEAAGSVISLARCDIELIVVDDGSTDERTLREMDVLRKRGIQVIRQENKGLAAARNAAIAVCSGEYILPLDADNRVRPTYFECAVRILDQNPKVGVVYGDAQYMGERTGVWHVGPFERERLLEWNFIDACAVYRRTVWEQNGGYDGTMPVQGLEDWDFWLSTMEHGWEFAYVPEVLFDYRVASGSMIAGTHGFEAQVEDFIATKHGLLYRHAWKDSIAERQSLSNERMSVRATSRNLGRLLAERLRKKVRGSRGNGRPHD